MSLIKYNPGLSPLFEPFEDLFGVFDALDPMHRPRPSINKPFQRSFTQSWTLPKNVDVEKVDAQYVNGVLTVSIPKREPAAPSARRIAIA